MSYQVFARKYRPRTFDDVLGQDHVVRTLRNAITGNRLAHAYLFVGPRGTGKTSTARIFAKALNCPGGPKADFDPDDPVCIEIAEGRSLDVLEIDGASNNGVEQVRELRENVKFAPSSGKFRIYYIDEVHMLSGAAFNALLKTLEEPPPHVKFIFATTEAHKVLPTIISRCQRFDLRRIPDRIIAEHLLYIAGREDVTLDPLAACAIAKGAEGGMRDAQSMLDQLVAFCGSRITEREVLDIFGFTAHETLARLVDGLLSRDTPSVLSLIHQQHDAGKDLGKLLGDLLGYLRSLLVQRVAPETETPDSPAAEIAETLSRQAAMVSTDRLLALVERFAEAEGPMKWAPNKKLHFEIAAIKGIQSLAEVSISDVINALSGGQPLPPSPVDDLASAPTAPQEDPGRRTTSPSAGKKSTNVKASTDPAEIPDSPRATTEAPDASPDATASMPASSGTAPAAEPGGRSPIAGESKSGGLTDGELWIAALSEIQRSRPLLAPWAACGVFCETKGRNLVVGFHPEDEHKRDHLDRPGPRETVRAIVTELAGRSVDVRFEIRAEIERPTEPLLPLGGDEIAETREAELPLTTGAPGSTESPAAGVDSASQAEGSGSVNAGVSAARDQAPPETGPEFYADSLIDEAMSIFEARRL